jgi:hypothetical protein
MLLRDKGATLVHRGYLECRTASGDGEIKGKNAPLKCWDQVVLDPQSKY